MLTSVKSSTCSQIVNMFAMERFSNIMALLFALIDLLISLNKGKMGNDSLNSYSILYFFLKFKLKHRKFHSYSMILSLHSFKHLLGSISQMHRDNALTG